MSVISITTFRLASGIGDEAFVVSDARYQTEFAYQQAGLLRRTTARSADGAWLVVTHWATKSDADNAEVAHAADPIAQAHGALMDSSSVAHATYATLG